MSHRLERFMQQFAATKPCPEIRWHDVVHIEAMGTDAFSAFQIWLTFKHSDGTEARVSVETKGYWSIVDSLHISYPSILPTWYAEMSEEPWHVVKVLYSRVADSD